jgi:hypothetical protein
MSCHIDHQVASEQKAMVFPEKCGECHKKELAEFRKSRHSIGLRGYELGEYLPSLRKLASFCNGATSSRRGAIATLP